MTPSELEEIKLRYVPGMFIEVSPKGISRATLDITRLLEEVERLQTMSFALSQGKVLELQSEIQRYRKALEKIANHQVKEPDYDWSDWDGGDAASEVRKIIGLIAKQALAKDKP